MTSRYSEIAHYYQADVHAMMISVVRVAMSKDGKPLNPPGLVENLRPICIGESLRRIVARCQLPLRLVKNGQYGCGFKRGAGTAFHLVSKLRCPDGRECPLWCF